VSETSTSAPAFRFDPAEAVHGSAFLTPVYFNKQVLTRFLYDSRFSCAFVSETYGSIAGSEFYISFGINRNGAIIVWLGDLEKLPLNERFYWLSENRDPENEVASEFFDAQIECVFTEPPAVIRCLNELGKFNARFHQKYSVHLYRDRSIEERIEDTRRYGRLLLNNVDDFKRFVSEFNEIINENTNNAEILRLLGERGIPFKAGLKGNKLLELVYENVLSDKENLVAPFFHLYDLRLWAAHSTGDGNLESVAKALRADSKDYKGIMEALIVEMNASIQRLLEKIA
jgi:hypothetical protein